MQIYTSSLQVGNTVTHPSFADLRLPPQAVILEIKANSMVELSNGLRLPLRTLQYVETGEQWVTIADYDRYLLSSHGKVVSLYYHGGNRERLLKAQSPTTYPKVSLTNETGTHQLTLSRLVAQAFLPPPEDARQQYVLPKDGNPLNLRADNLHWADRTDTHDEVVINYLYRRGERHSHSKLTTQEVARIRELVAQGATRQAVADMFEVSRPTISNIIRRISRRHS